MHPVHLYATVTPRQQLLAAMHSPWRVIARIIMILLSAQGFSPVERLWASLNRATANTAPASMTGRVRRLRRFSPSHFWLVTDSIQVVTRCQLRFACHAFMGNTHLTRWRVQVSM